VLGNATAIGLIDQLAVLYKSSRKENFIPVFSSFTQASEHANVALLLSTSSGDSMLHVSVSSASSIAAPMPASVAFYLYFRHPQLVLAHIHAQPCITYL
jgi:hypothetical protein